MIETKGAIAEVFILLGTPYAELDCINYTTAGGGSLLQRKAG